MNIGKSIRLALAERDMQKQELAEKMGVTRTTITNLLNSTTCAGSRINDLCGIFDMKASDFIALGE